MRSTPTRWSHEPDLHTDAHPQRCRPQGRAEAGAGVHRCATRARPDSPEGAHFEALITLIEAYEAKHYPVSPPDPIGAIRFRMEQAGLSAADLKPYIGGLNRVYEVLNGKRGLTWR